MLKVGAQNIVSLYVGGTKIKQAYVGEEMVYGPPKTYTVTATIDPAGAGTVTGAGQYQEGESVTVTATPAEGYTFSGWTENGATVSTSESYTFTVTGNRALVAAFEVRELHNLPEGYTELKYIESTGAQYINTFYIPTGKTKVVIDLQPTGQTPENGSYQYYFGAIYKSGTGSYSTTMYQAARGSSGNYCAMVLQTSGSRLYKFDENNYGTDRIKVTVDAKNKEAHINSNPPSSVSAPNTFFNYMSNLYLLGRNSNNTSISADGIAAKLYSAEIYEDDTMVRHLIPCKNDSGDVGVFDLISELFYGSVGSGTMVAGPAA